MLLQRGEQPLAYTWQPRRLAQLKVPMYCRNFYCTVAGLAMVNTHGESVDWDEE